jgi:hypothetical protein
MLTDGVAITAFVISTATFAFNIIWAPFAKRQSEQIKLAMEFKRQYVLDCQGHLDTLYAYKEAHKSGEDPYWLYWQRNMADGLPNDNEEKRVDTACRVLSQFWDEIFEFYHAGALPTGECHPLCGPKSMGSSNFLRKALKFQELVEPVACANWYRLGIDLEKQDKKDPKSKPKGDYGPQCQWRPGRYSYIDGINVGAIDWHKELAKVVAQCRAAEDNWRASKVSPEEVH